MDTLFQFARMNREDDLMEFLSSVEPDEIDLEMRDSKGNYLIYIVIVKGQTQAVRKLIDYGAHLEVLDSDGTSILHYPIKYGQDEILGIILDASDRNIGSSVATILDARKRLPIHYAISYQNIVALQELIRRGSGVNYVTVDGVTPLHMAIIKRNTAIARILIRSGAYLNAQKKGGFTPLHIATNLLDASLTTVLLDAGADPYVVESSYGFPPIHYAAIQNNLPIIKLFVDRGFDINFQDSTGNTIIYYAIIAKDTVCLEYYQTIPLSSRPSKGTIHVNQTNAQGETLLGVFLENYSTAYRSYLESIIEKTDLNIQDANSETPLHRIARHNYWYLFEDVLRTKKLGIYLSNTDGDTPYSLTPEPVRNHVINLVVDSYFAYLRRKPERAIDWERNCLESLSEDCEERARTEIIRGSLPYPLATNILDPYRPLSFTTFTGKLLDILSGFSLVAKKHPGVGLMGVSGTHNPPDLENYYRTLGLVTDAYHSFVQIEIKWIFQKLFFCYLFEENLVKALRSKRYSYLIVPIGIKLQNGDHSNGLLIDLTHLEDERVVIERFEPHGTDFPRVFNYNPKLLDSLLSNRLTNIIRDSISPSINVVYISPRDYLPQIGFQAIEAAEKDNINLGDPGGFCALWTIWYLGYRVRYRDISDLPKSRTQGGGQEVDLLRKIFKRLLAALRLSRVPLRSTIRSYSREVTDFRDGYLKNKGYDVNDYINRRIPLDVLHQIGNEMLLSE